MNIVRQLVREEIAKLLKDDTLFKSYDGTGLVDSPET